MSTFHWKSVATTNSGAIIQQRYKLLGGNVLVPTEMHRVVSAKHDEMEVFELP